MKKFVFSVFDIKAKLYSPPWFMNQKGEAIRAFKSIADDKQTMVGRHPNDFELYHLGTWDDLDGYFTMADKPTFLVTAADLLDVKEGDVVTGIKTALKGA